LDVQDEGKAGVLWRFVEPYATCTKTFLSNEPWVLKPMREIREFVRMQKTLLADLQTLFVRFETKIKLYASSVVEKILK
jgi:hypothetical protein